GLEGGRERSNSQMFLRELTLALGLDPPAPGGSRNRDYIFERTVTFHEPDGTASTGFIDLYKKGCFVLEAKQSRQKDGKKAVPGQADLFKAEDDTANLGRRTADRAWDVLMLNARRQAEDYAKALEPSEGWPPFLLVCDVGHCFEVYADFTGQGKNYQQFPDRNGFRIYLEEVRDEKVVKRLRAIWTNPRALDPAAQSAKVTREIAGRLAAVSKVLEERKHDAEDVALFLMRCLFTMFAEDVKLLPEGCFKTWLAAAQNNPSRFKHELAQLWQAMDKGGYATIAETEVRQFNGRFFRSASVLDLKREEIGELLAAAKHNWKEVDPAIFGTLLEQALKKEDRDRLGAHYTPRTYVERLVVVTIMEPLHQEWARVQATAERLKLEADELERQAAAAGDKSLRRRDDRSVAAEKASDARGKRREASEAVRGFHARLCKTRVLDPACGTGNFLYVAMELMKGLEGEVLDALGELGGQDALGWMADHAVDPHQFLGLEKNERAAAISELVVWLGYLQLHYRGKSGHPNEPILRDFRNITVTDAVLTWDDYPLTKVEVKDGKRMETYPNARRPKWPEAEFIVGNPPFIGNKRMRNRLGDGYVETLRAAHFKVPSSAEFVMYWWDIAAEYLTKKDGTLIRFGLVTTNSITELYQREVIRRRLASLSPISIIFAIPDHPWTKATEDFPAVRIAMTVAARGRHEGVLREVVTEMKLDTDQPRIELSERFGRINEQLSIGPDVAQASQLLANTNTAFRGITFLGRGFVLRPEEVGHFAKHQGARSVIRPYISGRDVTTRARGVHIIDLFGYEQEEVRTRYPAIYQRLLETVKPLREKDKRESYRDKWWVFAEPRAEFREAVEDCRRYIATSQTSKHRIFQFIDSTVLPDQTLVAIATDDAYILGVVSSRLHAVWAAHLGATLEDRPRYTNSYCFDPFPFPDCSDALKAKIRAVAEELDAHRKARQAE
ncbi:MAG: class I SAM-dependent DNA methyltransferase, partial [Burkholderiales bacterium]